MSVIKWLGKIAQSTVDPGRQQRIDNLEAHLIKMLKSGGQNFSIGQVQLPPDFSPEDLRDASERLFSKQLERAWADQVITVAESKQLSFLIRALQIPKDKVQAMQLACVKRAFEIVLAKSIDDGVIDAKEKKHLSHITGQAGISLGDFVNTYFKSECEDFLRGVFLNAVNDGAITQEEWGNLVSAMEALGVSKDEFFSKIAKQAKAFVEHVLADAKSDECISPDEESYLLWLLDNLKLPKPFCRYVVEEINSIKSLEQIAAGKLPSIEAPEGLETVGGELVHAAEICYFHQTRNLKSGPKVTIHEGILFLTDRKIVFVSASKSLRLSYRSILVHAGNESLVKFRAQNKPEILLELEEPDRTVYPIFCSALAIANQTKTASSDGKRSRHISRDVRQTVWRQYGGRCADCEADDYLEFDHIIPVAKGGSNAVANIQLLCRRCNNKKSDRI
jgi:hypothetical protein